jgi:hypothetical protein
MIATDKDYATWDAEASAVPSADAAAAWSAIEEDRAADKARIKELEERLSALEKYIWKKPRGVDAQLKWAERSFDWANEKSKVQDEHIEQLGVRLEGLEDFFGMPSGGWQGVGLYDGQDVSIVQRVRDPQERRERNEQLLAAYQMTQDEREAREEREAQREGEEGNEATEDERAPPSMRLRPPTSAPVSSTTGRSRSSSPTATSTAPTAGRPDGADGLQTMPSAERPNGADGQPMKPTAEHPQVADGPPVTPTADAPVGADGPQSTPLALPGLPSSPTQRHSPGVPAVNVIPATPHSSQGPSQLHTGPPVTAPCAHLTPPRSSAPLAPPVATGGMPPQPPWRMDEDMAAPTTTAEQPAVYWGYIKPPSSTLLTVPGPDATQPKSRRSRSRSPSPGPTRRSPRLKSPSPQPPPNAPAAPRTHGDLGAPMEVDK